MVHSRRQFVTITVHDLHFDCLQMTGNVYVSYHRTLTLNQKQFVICLWTWLIRNAEVTDTTTVPVGYRGMLASCFAAITLLPRGVLLMDQPAVDSTRRRSDVLTSSRDEKNETGQAFKERWGVWNQELLCNVPSFSPHLCMQSVQFHHDKQPPAYCIIRYMLFLFGILQFLSLHIFDTVCLSPLAFYFIVQPHLDSS